MNRPIAWRMHLPALFLIVLMLAVLWLGRPWAEPSADGLDALGRPVHWKWPPATIGAATFLWLVCFACDGLWDVVERGRKLFNPLALLDEGLAAWMLVRLTREGVAHGMPPAAHAVALTAGLVALVVAGALEWRRQPAVLPPPARASEDATAFLSDLEAARGPLRRWSYWSAQKPHHSLWLAALGSSCLIGAVAIPDGPVLLRLLLVTAGLLALSCSGGFRAVVTPRRLVLRAGHVGPLLVRIPTAEIVEVTVPEFDPVRDFGGWGIRRGLFGGFAGVWAFNLGSSGVLVRTREGKRYLIGTDEPARLAAALDAARRA